MAEFTSNMQSFKPSFPFSDVDPNMGILNHLFSELNPTSLETSTSNFHNLMGFSLENLYTQQVTDQIPVNMAENYPGIFHHDEKNDMLNSGPNLQEGNYFHESKKRKAILELESCSGNSSPQISDNGIKRKNNSGKGKKIKVIEKEEEKPKGVVHVRARRGQATDSHSLAERVRRGKINEKLRCLQGIVPGCHKTMGMAVMLDEIINYVQSLQNQVEFLSMRLTAASTFHDFNSDSDGMETLQRAKAFETQKMKRLVGRGYEELASTHLGPLDLTFGSYPSLPYSI